MTAPVDVLAGELRITNTEYEPGITTTIAEAAASLPAGTYWLVSDEARAAVAELIACTAVTVKAFEALGRTDNIVAQLESHRECERALVEQKAALASVQGGAE